MKENMSQAFMCFLRLHTHFEIVEATTSCLREGLSARLLHVTEQQVVRNVWLRVPTFESPMKQMMTKIESTNRYHELAGGETLDQPTLDRILQVFH